MNLEFVYNSLSGIMPEEQIRCNEFMKNHTSFQIGGPADIMVIPSTIKQIKDTLLICREASVPVTVMGNGTNLLVRDKGIRGVVIKIADKFSAVEINNTTIKAQSGVLLSFLASKALDKSLTGLEFASGIPGTLGGAVVMNAGAYGGEIKDVIKQVKVLDDNYNECILDNKAMEFGYRTSIIQKKPFIVVEVLLELTRGSYEESKALILELTKRRREKQPLSYPNAGSAFKRPVGYYAGKLIEDSGLKGLRVGDAQVSELHTGFIINLGNAKASDVIELINLIKKRVLNKCGVELTPEIRIIGEE